MLMRTDPFRDLDRLTQQVFGTSARPAVMPMDAWREGEDFYVELDLPGIDPAWITGTQLRLRPDFWPERGGMDGFFASRLQRIG